MSFDVWVDHRATDGDYEKSRQIFSAPLGAGDTVYRFWHTPAHEMKLELMSQIYNQGLSISAEKLKQLALELKALEVWWSKIDLDSEPLIRYNTINPDGSPGHADMSMRAHLAERASFLKEAIVLAETEKATLGIG